MKHPIDLPAIRRRADADPKKILDKLYLDALDLRNAVEAHFEKIGADAAQISACRADVPALCDEVERLRELVRRAYLEGFSTGNGFMALPPGDDLMDSAVRCWKESSSKREV